MNFILFFLLVEWQKYKKALSLQNISDILSYDRRKRDHKYTGSACSQPENIDVEIPRNSLTVITGLSGSGKSSLAFDTILRKDSVGILRLSRLMPVIFWEAWNVPMWIR